MITVLVYVIGGLSILGALELVVVTAVVASWLAEDIASGVFRE